MLNSGKRTLCFHLGLLLGGVLLFLVWAYPFSFHLATRAFDKWDSLLASWILAWDAKALFDPQLSVWNAPMFYPAPGALAFAENLFGVLWVSLPVQWLTGNPVLAVNVAGLVSFILCFYTCALLAHTLSDNIPASIIAGFIFAFHPIRWGHFEHLQLLPFYWAPLTLLFIIKFFRTSLRRYIWLTAAAICAQYYCSIYLGTILAVFAAVYVAVFLGLSAKTDNSPFSKLTRAAFVHLALAGLAFAVLLLPVGWPYIKYARYWGFFRDLQECTIHSSEPLSFLKPFGFAHYGWLNQWLPKVRGAVEGAAFLGVVPLLLTGFGIVALFRARRPASHAPAETVLVVTAFSISAVVMAILMFGPYFIWMGKVTKFPLPYQLVYYCVPGGRAMRAPGRFIQPLILCLSMVSAFGVSYAWKSPTGRNRFVRFLGLSAFALLFCYDFRYSPNDGTSVEAARSFPPVYDYLKTGPANRAVLEIPANDDRYRYLLYQTAHWRPEISGVSGRSTPAAELLDNHLRELPEDYGLNLLRLSPTMTLVAHLDQFDEATREQWENVSLEKYGFKRQGRFGNALVWERVAAPPASVSNLRIVNYDVASSELLLTPAERSRPWTRPELGLDKLTVRETSADGATRAISVPFRPPPFIIENEMIPVEVPLPRWRHKAVTKVEISGKLVLPYAETGESNTPLWRDSLTSLPSGAEATSLNPNAILLAKLLAVEGISDGMHVPRNANILVRAKVENVGKAVWLTPASTTAVHKSAGYVSVGLRWYKRAIVKDIQSATGKAAVHEGRIPIAYDMPPTAVATLSHAVMTPDEPGEYVVFVEMVSDYVCWFTDTHNSDVRRYNVVVE